MLTTTALPRGTFPFYKAIGQIDATRAAECIRGLAFTSDVAGALLPTAQALYNYRELEGLELLSSLLVLDAGNDPRDLFADQVEQLNRTALRRIRTIIMGGPGNIQRAGRFLAHKNLLMEIRLALQDKREPWQKPIVVTPNTVEAPETLQFFYSALWMGNATLAETFVEEIDFTPQTIEMLFPVTQAYHRVNGWKALELMRALFTLEGADEMRASLSYAVGNATRQDLRSTAQIIDRIGDTPNTLALFRTRPAYLDAVRRALTSGKASQITQIKSGNGDRFTDEDWEFMLDMSISEGAWTRDSLLALTTHVSAVEWSVKNSLEKFYRTLADLCRQSRNHIIKQRNGINRNNIAKIEADLAKLGLSFGMPIDKPNARTMARYALQRSGIEPGDKILLESNVVMVLRGMPLSAADVDEVNELLPEIPPNGWRQTRKIATLNALLEILPVITGELGDDILQRTTQTLRLMGFNDLADQTMYDNPNHQEDEEDSYALI